MARSSLPGGCRPRSRAPGSLDTSDYADSVFGSTRGSVSDFNDDSVFRSESQSSDPDDSWSFYNSRTPLQSDESPQGAPAGTSTPIVKSSLPPRRLFPSTPLPPSPGIPETPKIVRDHFEGCKVKRITPERDERPWHMAPGVADTFLKSDNIWKLDSSTFDPFLRSNITTAVMFYKQSVNYEPKYKLAKKKFIRAAENPINEKGAYAAVDCGEEAELCQAQNVDLQNPVFRLYAGQTLLGDVIEPFRFNKLRPDSATDESYEELNFD